MKTVKVELTGHPVWMRRTVDLGFLMAKIKEAEKEPAVTGVIPRLLQGLADRLLQDFKGAVARGLGVTGEFKLGFDLDSEKGPILLVQVQEEASPVPDVRRFNLN